MFHTFGDIIINWMKLFYNKLKSTVINGLTMIWLNAVKSCRQGDPMSPYLFILCAEVMAIQIREAKK